MTKVVDGGKFYAITALMAADGPAQAVAVKKAGSFGAVIRYALATGWRAGKRKNGQWEFSLPSGFIVVSRSREGVPDRSDQEGIIRKLAVHGDPDLQVQKFFEDVSVQASVGLEGWQMDVLYAKFAQAHPGLVRRPEEETAVARALREAREEETAVARALREALEAQRPQEEAQEADTAPVAEDVVTEQAPADTTAPTPSGSPSLVDVWLEAAARSIHKDTDEFVYGPRISYNHGRLRHLAPEESTGLFRVSPVVMVEVYRRDQKCTERFLCAVCEFSSSGPAAVRVHASRAHSGVSVASTPAPGPVPAELVPFLVYVSRSKNRAKAATLARARSTAKAAASQPVSEALPEASLSEFKTAERDLSEVLRRYVDAGKALEAENIRLKSQMPEDVDALREEVERLRSENAEVRERSRGLQEELDKLLEEKASLRRLLGVS